mgnify:CR=1 FL=1
MRSLKIVVALTFLDAFSGRGCVLFEIENEKWSVQVLFVFEKNWSWKSLTIKKFFETVGNSSKNSYVIHSIEKLNFKDNYIYKNSWIEFYVREYYRHLLLTQKHLDTVQWRRGLASINR